MALGIKGFLPTRPQRRQRFNLTNPQYLLAQALKKGISTGPARGGWTEGLSRLGQAFIAKRARDEAEEKFKQREAAYDARVEARNTALQRALGQMQPREVMVGSDAPRIGAVSKYETRSDLPGAIQTLSGNQDLAEMAYQLQIKEMDKKNALNQALRMRELQLGDKLDEITLRDRLAGDRDVRNIGQRDRLARERDVLSARRGSEYRQLEKTNALRVRLGMPPITLEQSLASALQNGVVAAQPTARPAAAQPTAAQPTAQPAAAQPPAAQPNEPPMTIPQALAAEEERTQQAKTAGKLKAEAKFNMPVVLSNAKYLTDLVGKLQTHPGMSDVVGLKGYGALAMNLPFINEPIGLGTDADNFDVLLKQVGGKQFLAAFETLKGGGQITEIEGKKASEAQARLSAAQSEEEFIKSAKEYQKEIAKLVELAKKKAGVAGAPATSGPVTRPANIPVEEWNAMTDADKELFR